jgi:ATP-dependent Lon protease
MPRAQRRDDILKSELPPTLPLMALRSTIVYPLGTIAVQMGSPENLSLLRSYEENGQIVGLVIASGDHDDVMNPELFVGRVGVAARVHERINLPGETVQITLQGLRRIIVEGVEQREPYPVARVRGARETIPDPVEAEELMTRLVSAAETLAELVERIAVGDHLVDDVVLEGLLV